MPSYKKFGSGPHKVLALHGWFSDSSSYEPLLPYLDPSVFTFLFLDLRGYGVAKDFHGEYTLDEGVRDALTLVQTQGWDRFYLAADAMGSLIAQKIALEHAPRVQGIIAFSPVPASGSPKSPELLTFLETAAISCDKAAFECIDALSNRHYSPYIVHSLVKHWKETSSSKARLAYLHMLHHTDFSKHVPEKPARFLAVFGEHDLEDSFSALDKTFQARYPDMQFVVCKDAGHFLLRENPIRAAGLISKFVL